MFHVPMQPSGCSTHEMMVTPMHYYGDFEAVNSRIVAAAFVSEDGRQEEHWLMRPHRRFRSLPGRYAELLPYADDEIRNAPLLSESHLRFQRIISRAERLWFFDRSDLHFFETSFPYNLRLQDDFRTRYADAKPLVEEVLMPVYVRNTRDGHVVNLRHLINYLEEERLNSEHETELHRTIAHTLRTMHHILYDNRFALDDLLDNTRPEDATHYLTVMQLESLVEQIRETLHPFRLLSKDGMKNLRWFHGLLSRLMEHENGSVDILLRLKQMTEAVFEAQGQRLTPSKLTIPLVEDLIKRRHLPLEVMELFDEAGMDRDQCLVYLDRGIGLRTAASLLLAEEEAQALEGNAQHNALYDTQLLRLVCMNCFDRLDRISNSLGTHEFASLAP